MTGAAMLTALAFATAGAAHTLAAARWTYRAPRAAIVLWQAVGFAWGLAAVGALIGFGVAPYRLGVAGGLLAFVAAPGALPLGPLHVVALGTGISLAAVLLARLATAAVDVVRVRRRHRALLALVARGEPGLPGALVVDHPAAAAYCVPGVRSQVVVSAGTLRLLDRGELAAVLAHEHAHARERHDLVLLPFTSLRRVFPGLGIVSRAATAVELLLEMVADDRARASSRSARQVATALLRFAAAGPPPSPSGTMGTADAPVLIRVRRLLDPAPPPYGVRTLALFAAMVLAALPAVLYAIPH